MSLYPLLFEPRFVEKIWGGRKLQTILGKTLPTDAPIGESWEIFDFPPGVVDGSRTWVSAAIANGPLAGKTLHEALATHRQALMGDVPLVGADGQFPVLIKFLDAREDLSVQVHPDEKYAATHAGAHLKTEAWYVFQNDKDARLYRGLKAGATREAFEKAIADGTVEEQIEAIRVKEGQCFFLPSGTVHALGAGILAAEVQTPSDTTYRVYDFNRIDASTGKTRTLHVDQAMACIDFSGKSEPEQPRSHVASFFTTVTRLVTSPYFNIEKVRFSGGVEEKVPYNQPVVWIMLDGEAEIRVRGMEPVKFKRGQSVLLPAEMNEPMLKTQTDCTWLEVTFPNK